MRYLRAALNNVIADCDDDDEPVLKSNPVDRLNRLNQWAEVKRADRHLPEEQIAEWIEVVQSSMTGIKNDAECRDALLFILLTGARHGEVLGSAVDG